MLIREIATQVFYPVADRCVSCEGGRCRELYSEVGGYGSDEPCDFDNCPAIPEAVKQIIQDIDKKASF